MNTLTIDFLETLFKKEKENSLFGKWICLKDIQELLKKYEATFQVSQIGTSEQERPIYQLKMGGIL